MYVNVYVYNFIYMYIIYNYIYVERHMWNYCNGGGRVP